MLPTDVTDTLSATSDPIMFTGPEVCSEMEPVFPGVPLFAMPVNGIVSVLVAESMMLKFAAEVPISVNPVIVVALVLTEPLILRTVKLNDGVLMIPED